MGGRTLIPFCCFAYGWVDFCFAGVTRDTTTPIRADRGMGPSCRLSVLDEGLSPSRIIPSLPRFSRRLIRRRLGCDGCQATTTAPTGGVSLLAATRRTSTRSSGFRVGRMECPSTLRSKRRPQKSSNRSWRPAAAIGGLDELIGLRRR